MHHPAGAGGCDRAGTPAATSDETTAEWSLPQLALTLATAAAHFWGSPALLSGEMSPVPELLEKPSRAAAWWPKEPAPWTTMNRVDAAPSPFSPNAAPIAAAAAARPLVQRVSSLCFSVMAAPPSLTMTRRGRVILVWRKGGGTSR